MKLVRRDVLRKSKTAVMFALTVWTSTAKEKVLHGVLMHVEKTYDQVSREQLWSCRRKSAAAEESEEEVQGMHEDNETGVWSAATICSESRWQVGGEAEEVEVSQPAREREFLLLELPWFY